MATSACQDLAQRLRIVVAYEPADMASAACDILSEAIRLHGAFAGSEYAELRTAILHPPSECPSDMQLGEPCHAHAANKPKVIAWDRVAGLLAAGELAEWRTKYDVWRLHSWVTACHTAADAIERADDEEESETPLGERARLVLTVLVENTALDSDRRMTTADVAVKAAGNTADPNQYKAVIAELKDLGYVRTKEGRGGGCWLTDLGRKRAEKL